MTDGTSQGLFIVVAIVIFGIFTVMAYILFEDTLSPSLANMFTDATEQATNALNKWKHIPITIDTFTNADNAEILKQTSNSLTYSVENHTKWGNGAVIGSRYFEPDKQYMLTYTLKKVNGTIGNIGGHLHFSHDTEVYMDGTLVGNRFTTGFEFPNDKDSVDVTVIFDTKGLKSIDGKYGAYEKNETVFHSPHVNLLTNRTDHIGSIAPHTAEITNIRLSVREIPK